MMVFICVNENRVLDTVVFVDRTVYFSLGVVGRMLQHPTKIMDLAEATIFSQRRLGHTNQFTKMLTEGEAVPNLDVITQMDTSCLAQLLGGGTGILFSTPGRSGGKGGGVPVWVGGGRERSEFYKGGIY